MNYLEPDDEDQWTFVVQDAGGEYLCPGGGWSPASNEARQFVSNGEAWAALKACGRSSACVVAWRE